MSRELSIRYPRRIVARRAIKFFGRFLTSILARPTVTGRENLPEKGPLILVGNHVAVIEIAMMTMYSPWPIEVMGAGDIPLDPRYAWMADWYGMIPIKRGQMDREGLNMALDVLKQDGIVGLFPEGGIWETNIKQARNGVAWLSNKSNAPIVPMGFGGMEGALDKIGKFKRPKLTMNIGEVIPAVNVKVPGKSRKEVLSESANMIMERVAELIPEEERRMREQTYIGESFDFQTLITDAQGSSVAIPADYDIIAKEALSKLFHRPVMLDVFNRNLKLPIKPLLRVDQKQDPADLVAATGEILAYIDTNPYFFHYRFGNGEGSAMVAGLRQLQDLARWASEKPGVQMQLKPIRRYTLVDTNEEVIEDTPAHIHEM